jgi:hypothetical protein
MLFSLHKGMPDQGQWVVACLQGAWPKLLGERLAAVCKPVLFEGADLRIEILDRDWEGALRSVRTELLDKLRSATANEVRTLSFSRQSFVGSR